MSYYSQNKEEQYIVDYFKGFTGTLLDIGANDGITLSNSRKLIELGWHAVLIEPSPRAFVKLKKLYEFDYWINTLNVAIGAEDSEEIFYESGCHLSENDIALVSTMVKKEKLKWINCEYDEIKVPTYTYKTLADNLHKFDFITIDAEGMDLIILKQIDLSNTKLLCIEWNSLPEVKKEMLSYTSKFNMNKIIYQSPENLLICR